MKIREGITFDDVLLEPAKSSVLPAEANVKTKITKKISLSIPLISASAALAVIVSCGFGQPQLIRGLITVLCRSSNLIR